MNSTFTTYLQVSPRDLSLPTSSSSLPSIKFRLSWSVQGSHLNRPVRLTPTRPYPLDCRSPVLFDLYGRPWIVLSQQIKHNGSRYPQILDGAT